MIVPIPVSVVVLTYNEEANLPDCLASLSQFDDIHVLDSGSADRTTDIASQCGARVYQNPFHGFGSQRNWAIDHVPAKYEWHFHIDADERMTPELVAELRIACERDADMGGYYVPSKLIFAGRWLKRAGQYPAYQVRFFNKHRLRFLDYGHGQRETTTAPIGTLREPLIHYGFSKGLDAWFIKHIYYARREAEQAMTLRRDGGGFFSRDPVARRRAIKRLAARLPARYFLRLVYLLIARLAFLDGWAGITYAHMLATYEGMIDVYLKILARKIDPDTLAP